MLAVSRLPTTASPVRGLEFVKRCRRAQPAMPYSSARNSTAIRNPRSVPATAHGQWAGGVHRCGQPPYNSPVDASSEKAASPFNQFIYMRGMDSVCGSHSSLYEDGSRKAPLQLREALQALLFPPPECGQRSMPWNSSIITRIARYDAVNQTRNIRSTGRYSIDSPPHR